MSVRVTSRIWDEATEYSGGPLLVLLALADWSNDEGWCWPSVPSIAKKSRLTERQVYSVLGQLEADGVIERKGGGGRGKFTKYRVLVAALGAKKNPEMASGFTGSDPGATRAVEKPRNPEAGNSVSAAKNPEICDTKTLKSAARIIEEPSEEPPKNRQAPVVPIAVATGTLPSRDPVSQAVAEAAEYVCRSCGWTRRRIRREVARQLSLRAEAGESTHAQAEVMIRAWEEFCANRDRLRKSWSAAEFVGDGIWRTSSEGWPWTEEALEEMRRRQAACVGMNR